MTPRLGLGATLAAAVLLVAACSSSAATPPAATKAPATQTASATPTQAPPTQAASVAPSCAVDAAATGTPAQIKGSSFPSGLTVKAGEAITWSNADSVPHTVTFDDGSCASGNIGGGSSVTVRYTVPGVYAFHCAIHSRMSGRLEVTA